MSVSEISWLIEGSEESKKDYFEMVSYSVKNAMISVKKGKDMKMFEDDNKEEENKLTKEERQIEMAHLKNIFGEL